MDQDLGALMAGTYLDDKTGSLLQAFIPTDST